LFFSEKIWEEIGREIVCSNPCHTLLAMIHVLLSNASITADDGINASVGAAASLYLQLQRCGGTRSRGMTHAITFQYTIKVIGQFTCESEVTSEANKDETFDSFVDDSKSSHTRRYAKRNTKASEIPIGFENIAIRLLNEVDGSLKFLPLVVNENAENLDSLVQVIVGALSCVKFPSISSRAAQTLQNIALLKYTEAETLVFKSIMPLILGEVSVSTASSAKTLRAAGMTVISKLLGMLSDEYGSTSSLANSFLVLIEHLCHKAPEKVNLAYTLHVLP
jgi:hypothetical protein